MTIIFQSTNCKYNIHGSIGPFISENNENIKKVIYNEIFIALLFSYLYLY